MILWLSLLSQRKVVPFRESLQYRCLLCPAAFSISWVSFELLKKSFNSFDDCLEIVFYFLD